MDRDHILSEMNQTLDQLIDNAKAIKTASLKALTSIEMDAFEKTQESLFAHILSMDELLEKMLISLRKKNNINPRHQIQKKFLTFDELRYPQEMREKVCNKDKGSLEPVKKSSSKKDHKKN